MCRVKRFGRFKFCLIIKVIGKWKRIKNQQISLGMFYFTMSETLNSQRTAPDMTFLRSKAFGGLYGFQSVRETNKPQTAAFGETEQLNHQHTQLQGGKRRLWPSGISLTPSQGLIFLEYWSKCALSPVHFISLWSLWSLQISKIASWNNLAIEQPIKISYPIFQKDPHFFPLIFLFQHVFSQTVS